MLGIGGARVGEIDGNGGARAGGQGKAAETSLAGVINGETTAV